MNAALKPKHQRLVLLTVALVALVGAALLAMWGVRERASYFYVPSDIAAEPPDPGQAVRLGDAQCDLEQVGVGIERADRVVNGVHHASRSAGVSRSLTTPA